jgi:hypothetical protein
MSFIVWHSLVLLGVIAVSFTAGYITGKVKHNELDRDNHL